MASRRRLFAGILAALSACAVLPDEPVLPPYQSLAVDEPQTVVRLAVRNKRQIQDLLAQGYDLFAPTGRTVDAVVTDAQLHNLQRLKVPFRVVHQPSLLDVEGLPQGYLSVAQIGQELEKLAQSKPEIAELGVIGKTYEQRPIWSLSIGKKQPKMPAVLFMGGVHARELAPVELAMRLARQLVNGYGQDPQITQWLNTREVVIVPEVNVDGRVAVEQGHSMWRKSRHPFPGGTGVDLNRNFDAHWAFEGAPKPDDWSQWQWDNFKSQFHDPSEEVYAGPGANSEPETQALVRLFDQKRFTVSIDLHAYGEMMIWPLGFTNQPTPDLPHFRKIWQTVAPMYRGGTSMEILYPTAGTTKDFAYERFRSLGYTIEVGTGSDGFRPTFDRVDRIWKQLAPGLMNVVAIADNPRAP